MVTAISSNNARFGQLAVSYACLDVLRRSKIGADVVVGTLTKDTSMSDLETLPQRLRLLRKEIRDEYLRPHNMPWVIGFSGGKDSTLLAQLVIECIQNVAPDERKRKVYLVSNDTLVESPVFQAFVDSTLNRVTEGTSLLNVPIEVVKTNPDPSDTFWINLLGKGYPAPNRSFRWCTDRMKIRPTTKFIRDRVSDSGQVILLLGVRKSESANRAQTISKYADAESKSKFFPHNDIDGCLIYRPIEDLGTDEVWHILLNNPPPWGGSHRDMATLYRNAQGGECPFVTGDDEAPSCGTNSARFGCWTCTVIDKDNSLSALIDVGFEHLEPLADFRDRLKTVSASPNYRSMVRRNGQPGLGPLTFEARKMLLEELLKIQDETKLPLITDHEVRMVREWWAKDQSDIVVRELAQYIQLNTGNKPK